ncbi:MAG: hypothetical protein PHT60_13100 [Acidiphilium sp.]|nr:hypothetical protein [Acidiphilium sp.]MDD4936699.1 hypothetical protein [Acidiphilium sp.]
MPRVNLAFLAFAMLSIVATPQVARADSVFYRLVSVIPLPTTDRSGDVVSFDPGNDDVYVSMGKGDGGGVVISAKDDKIVAVIRHGITRPAGEAFGRHYVYWTSNTGHGAHQHDFITVVSKQTWRVVKTIPTVGTSPDGIWADPKLGKLYVAMDDDNWVDIYTLGADPKFIGKIALTPKRGSGPDIGMLVSGKNELFIPDDSWEDEIDLNTDRITRAVDVSPASSLRVGRGIAQTKGQIYDPQTHSIWVATDRDGIYALDSRTLKIEAHLPARAGADEMAFDPGLQLVYGFESDAAGFNVYNARTRKLVGFVSTGFRKTHTGAVDPANHDVFVYAGNDEAVLVYQPVLKSF